MRTAKRKEPWYNQEWFVVPVFSMMLGGAACLAAKLIMLFALFVASLFTFPMVLGFAGMSAFFFLILRD